MSFALTAAQDRAMDAIVSDAMNVALGGGSRSGKTLLLVRAVILRALKEPNSRHAIFRYRFNAIKSSVIADTLPKVMSLCFEGLWGECVMDRTDWFLTLPNGSQVWFGGLDDKDRTEKILGMEFATIYFNECSQIPYQSVLLALTRLAQKTKGLRLKAYYDFNPPAKTHWTYRVFVDRKDPNSKKLLPNPEDYAFYLINPADNAENLDPKYLEMLERMPEKQRNRFLLGKFAEDGDGALWTEEVLAETRHLTGELPDFVRIVVAVDPSGCAGDEDMRSDEVGITVCALGSDSHGYLLEDLSGRWGPAQWAEIACSAYERHRADKIIGEKNFGGAMVEHTLRTANPDIPYEEVTATRGKVIRAEPIAALYNQGKIHHVGYFEELEDQMLSMTLSGYMGLKSPDRADSAIWGFSHLFPMITESRERKDWVPPSVKSAPRSASRYSRRR